MRLEEEDIPGGYLTEPHPYVPGALMLAHKSGGECVYLEGARCSIHGRAPALCRAADCRALALKIGFETAQRLHVLGRLDFRVWNRGQELLAQLRKEERRR